MNRTLTPSAQPVLHPGLPKTATTWMQERVLARSEVLHAPAVQRLRHECGRQRPHTQAAPDALRSAFHEIAAKIGVSANSNPTIPIISCEGLLAKPAGSVHGADAAWTELGPCKVVIVLRHPFRWTESLYLWRMRSAHRRPWGAGLRFRELGPWLKRQWNKPGRGRLAALWYGQAIARYEALFGAHHVAVLLYEQLQEDPAGFLRSLGRFIGADPDKMVEAADAAPLNTRPDRAHLSRLRAWASSPWRQSLFRILPRAQKEAICEATRPENLNAETTGPYWPNTWSEFVYEQTAPWNLDLAERKAPLMKHYGYPGATPGSTSHREGGSG
jgi:hypothetical protein